MKRLLLLLVSLAALRCASLDAQTQDIAGTWQGTLSFSGHDLRQVFKIVKDGAGYKSTDYSIDQKAQAPVSSTTLTGSNVKMSIQAIGGAYEARLSPDGNTMTGTFSQGSTAIPLVLAKVTEAAAWTIPEPPARIPMMAADARPVFEVATIKPASADEQGQGFMVRGGEFSMRNDSLMDMLAFAFGLQQKQFLNAPAWATDQRFDTTGKPDIAGTPNSSQLENMTRELLKDRFALKYHMERKELSAYALTVAKTGNKMTKSEGDANSLPGLFFQGLGILNVQNATMKDFTGLMQSAVLDRPVVDQTGLAASRWNFLLKWTPDDSQFNGMAAKLPPPSDPANAPPALFTAMPQQLGLHLDAVKTMVEVMVIDHVEKPTGN